jgi:NAD(P)-dependent dehydrogenase (short-subunit alcohol dehydrogenase family)
LNDPLELARAKWSGRTAVVTGAGSGLGAAFSRVLAGIGASVVLADVDGAAVSAAAKGVGEAVVTDVGDSHAVDDLAHHVRRVYGEIALVINNAGVEHVGYLWERSPEDWRRLIDVNLSGVFYGIRAFVPLMLADGNDGVVLNVASTGAFMAGPQHTVYQLTKQGVLVLSEGLAAELAAVKASITVAVAIPGAVRTNLYADAGATTAGDPQRERVQTLLTDRGMAPDDAAALMLEQVAHGEFIVTTDRDGVRQAAAARADRLRDFLGP